MSKTAPIPELQILWFKRDLRVYDHRALTESAHNGAVLPLYIVEPSLWDQPDMSARQWDFVADCLHDLRAQLAALGQPLIVRIGAAREVLQTLYNEHRFTALWSHEETGNEWTYARDRAVGAWCREKGLPWHERQNFGVVRRLKSRDGWATSWEAFMAEPVAEPPKLTPLPLEPGPIPTSLELGLLDTPCPKRQIGGRAEGLEQLTSFLNTRGATYQRAMSSPLEGEYACSRLSPYLTFGSLSMREVAQTTWAAQMRRHGERSGWGRALNAFNGRLHWHCHFIQKLEDAPKIEWEEMHPAYKGLRPSDPALLHAWETGETGLPFVDACMRYLRATGWLNFRMRAMVMSTASYHLWLDWRATGQALARLFTDYEPGIHWSQVQMQSGTTGINSIRIYNPVKQGFDQDPQGIFTRRWVPELSQIEDAYLQEPWKAPNAGKVLGHRYPEPIVDHLTAAREAKERIWAVRKQDSHRAQAARVLKTHGSRSTRRHGKRRAKTPPTTQMSFSFGDDT